MGGNRFKRTAFAPGDFVFAKLHGYRPWPARVLGSHGSHSKLKYSVFFYGTCNTAKVSPTNIFDFSRNQRRLGALRSRITARNADFRGAMAHMRLAFERPENDFVYYQVLARMEGEGGSSVTYEMLTSSTDTESESNEAHSGDSTEIPETQKSKHTEQGSEEEDDTKKTESTSKEDEEPQPAKKPKILKPLLDEEDDDQAQILNAMEKELDQLDGDKDLFSGADSDSFELEGNPLVRSAHMTDFKEQDNSKPISRTIEELLRKLNDESDLGGNDDGEDDDSENDQPIDLCCRHITGDEQ